MLVNIASQHGSGQSNRVRLLVPVELICFAQQTMDRFAGWRKPLQHLEIKLGERSACIHDQHQAHQRISDLNIAAQQLLPVMLGCAGYLGVAVAG